MKVVEETRLIKARRKQVEDGGEDSDAPSSQG
jgi:hypothetical protein